MNEFTIRCINGDVPTTCALCGEPVEPGNQICRQCMGEVTASDPGELAENGRPSFRAISNGDIENAEIVRGDIYDSIPEA